MPDGYLSQLVYPFRGTPDDQESASAPGQTAVGDPTSAPTATAAVTNGDAAPGPRGTPEALEFTRRGSSALGGETRDLLRDRIARIALLVAAGLTFFLIRDTLLPEQAYLPNFRAVLIAVYAAIGLRLRGARAISLHQLRVLETAMLWSLSGWFAADRIFWMEARAEAGDVLEVIFTVDFSVLVYVSFITAYAVFIPNRWPRAVLMTMPLAILPAVIVTVVLARHPQHADLLAAGLTPTRATSLGLMLVLALAFAGFGARLIHSLRTQAWEARELGAYRLVKKIGEGGMGEVWKAEHKLLPRPAAIKLVRAELIHARSGLEAQEVLRRFEREVRATSNLRSPHTVEIYDFGITDELVFYYVMELLDGLDLNSLVRRDGPLPDGRVVHLLLQACESLDEAHSAGLVHRDIKPANIFACRLGNRYDYIKLLDFGLVAAADPGVEETAQVRGGIAGTPAYMAPEILRGEPFIDHRADLYALGCVGYWLLTGSLVFAETTPRDMARAHLERTPQGAGERRGYPVDGDLEAAILACLHKEPAQRPQTANELAQRLRASAAHGSWSRTAAKTWWEHHAGRPPRSTPV